MIYPGSAQQEIAAWQRRLIRALEQAQACPARQASTTTPERRIALGNRAQLLHFAGPAEPSTPPQEQRRRPVLIVYSLVNRPSILDLTERRSWLRALLDAGHPVYLLDWQEPYGADRFLSLDEHIEHYISTAASLISRQHDASPPHILGICQGGTLALCHALLHPELVGRIVNLVTPVDFHTPHDQLSRMAQQIDLTKVTDALGNISAHWLNAVFVALKPYRLLAQRYLDFPEIADNPQALEDFLRLERWMYDSPNQPATAFAQFVTDFYQRNSLIHGSLEICGKTLRLDELRTPILNIYAEHDHLVPPPAAQALGEHIARESYREICFAGGHLGVFISRRAHHELVPQALAWFAEEQE
jgi:polyhydroxyalkanoate synthase